MEYCVDSYLFLGCIAPIESPDYVSTPNIAPRKPPTMFRMAISTAAVSIFLLTTDINNVLSDVKGSKCCH